MLSYQRWVQQPVSDDFMSHDAAQVAQQVEPGAICCGGRKKRRRRRRRSGRALFFKRWTQLREEDRPLFITQGPQLLNWRRGESQPEDQWMTMLCRGRLEVNISLDFGFNKHTRTWMRRHTQGSGIKPHRRTLEDLMSRQSSTVSLGGVWSPPFIYLKSPSLPEFTGRVITVKRSHKT